MRASRALLGLLVAAIPMGSAMGQAPPQPADPGPSLPPPILGVLRPAPAPVAPGTDDFARLVESVRTCAGRGDQAEKARCVDALSGSLLMTRTPARDPSLENMGGWLNTNDADAVAVGLGSQSFQSDDELYRDGSAQMFVRCRDGHSEAFVSFGRRVTDRGVRQVPVGVRFDDGEYEPQVWSPSVSGMAIGVWADDRARSLMAKIERSRKFVLRLTLPEKGALFIPFTVAEANVAFRRVKEKCAH